MDQDKRYFLKRPGKGRKSFDLVCYTSPDRRTKQYQPLSLELKAKVVGINAQYLSGEIDGMYAETLLTDLISAEYRRLEVRDIVLKNSILSEVNQRVFNRFWAEVYEPKELEDAESARYDFLKAIRLIEPLSLLTAESVDFKKQLKKASNSEARRAIDRLRQILKYLGRDVFLFKPKEDLRHIRHVTINELYDLLKWITNDALKDLTVSLFASGMRLSEAMAVTERDYRDGILNVDKQLTRHGKLKRPKREKEGKVAVLPMGFEALQRWLAVPNKPDYRYAIVDALAVASRKAFPTDRTKWISPQDLRHSHAIHLLGLGADLTQVKLNLRNRIEVCEKYYTGYCHRSNTLEGLKSLF